jgi:hypothetical protein
MTGEQFERERRYQYAMSVLRRVREGGLLTASELAEADALLRVKYNPPIGSLYPLEPLTSQPLRVMYVEEKEDSQ